MTYSRFGKNHRFKHRGQLAACTLLATAVAVVTAKLSRGAIAGQVRHHDPHLAHAAIAGAADAGQVVVFVVTFLAVWAVSYAIVRLVSHPSDPFKPAKPKRRQRQQDVQQPPSYVWWPGQ